MYQSREREAPPERRRGGSLVRLRLLGVLSADEPSTVDVLRRVGAKPLALLAFCHLASPAGAIHRDSIVGLFWPDLDQARSRRALRQAVHALRTAFGRDVVHSLGKHLLALPGGAVASDVSVFRWLGREGRHEAALAFYGGDFMAGANLLHVSDELTDWIESTRRSLLEDAVAFALALCPGAAEAVGFKRCARRALELSGHRERVMREILTACAAHGHTGLAMDLYAEHCAWLDRLDGLRPTPATRALFAELFLRDPPPCGDAQLSLFAGG